MADGFVVVVEYDNCAPTARVLRQVGVTESAAGARALADADGAETDVPSPEVTAVLESTDEASSELRKAHYKGNYWFWRVKADHREGEAAERLAALEIARILPRLVRRTGWRHLEITQRREGRIAGHCVDGLGRTWLWEADAEENVSLSPAAKL